MQQWMDHPLTLYALAATSLILSLALFLALKAELSTLARRMRRESRALEAETAAARTDAAEVRQMLERLEASLREVEQASGVLVPPQPTRSGLNLTVRSQVLRRHRLGEEPEAIAASLGLPLSEVNLLLKVNRLVLANL